MKILRFAPVLALVAATSASGQDNAGKCGTCGNDNFGTSIVWEGSTSDAATKAKKEEKLVFVLHVSGYFEDPKFT